MRDFFLLFQSFRGFRVALWASLYWIEIPKKRVKFTHGLRTEKRGPKPPPLSFRDVFIIPGRRVLVVEKCVRHADIWRGKRRATTTTPGYLSMKWTPWLISCSRRYRRFSRARKDSGGLRRGKHNKPPKRDKSKRRAGASSQMLLPFLVTSKNRDLFYNHTDQSP